MHVKNGILLLPSLNRIELLKRFFKSYHENKWEMPGWLLVDKGDYLSKQLEYQELDLPGNWLIKQTTGVTMGDKCRELWDSYKDMEYVAILNDDHVICTPQGDKTMIASLRENMILGSNDGPTPDKPWMAPRKLAGITIWSGKVLRTVGYMFPPGLHHLYIDDVWEQLGGKCGAIQILMNVCVHHDHIFAGRVKDDTHAKVYPDGWNDPSHPNGEETRVYHNWLKSNMDKDVQKLMDIQPRQGLMLATPSHDGNVAFGYATGLTELAMILSQNNVHFEMARVIGSSLIPHARNSLVQMFLDSKCQRLLFVDSDQSWSKEAALALFQSNRRIIAGITPHKRFPINLNFEPLEEDKHYFKDLTNKSSLEFQEFVNKKADQTGEIEVAKAGTGFIMIDRSVFELMKPKVEEYMAFDNNPSILHREFFQMGAKDGKYQGEDWSFNHLAKELNIPVYISARSLVSHSGIFTWSLGM